MEPSSRHHELLAWVDHNGSFLYCWLRARLGPAVRRDLDIEDLLQEVWARAMGNSRQSIANPRAWLLSIARNVVSETLRSMRREETTTSGTWTRSTCRFRSDSRAT